MPIAVHPKLLSWASDIDDATLRQAEIAARLPVVVGHVALMPDAHLGIGATIGSVIPTDRALIPSAVGVDIGCGMVAAELDLHARHLPDDLTPVLHRIGRVIPAGVGKGHKGADRHSDWDSLRARAAASQWLTRNPPASDLSKEQLSRAADQFGTLGSGNHFLELCLDERDQVWVMLHSGSRGIGNTLATGHIARAKKLAKHAGTCLDDPDLAWFTQGSAEFEAYLADALWSQDYARANRDRMMDVTLHELGRLFAAAGPLRELRRVNCHHNFCAQETFGGRDLWITRKGAIRARAGELGIVPGSMGAKSYIVRGLGNPASWMSCSHGAGRRMSRNEAKRRFQVADLARQMEGRTWLADRAGALIDEIPSAYKDIDQVMADQADLVEIVHTLRQVVNYKGT